MKNFADYILIALKHQTINKAYDVIGSDTGRLSRTVILHPIENVIMWASWRLIWANSVEQLKW